MSPMKKVSTKLYSTIIIMPAMSGTPIFMTAFAGFS